MSDVLRVRFPGEPRPLERPRSKGGQIQPYDTPRNRQLKKAIAALWQAAGHQPFDRGIPLVLLVEFRFERAKGHYGTGRNAGILKASAPRAHVQIPDLDNLIKLVKDALKTVAWHDDCQVTLVEGSKHWADDEPCTIISLCRAVL